MALSRLGALAIADPPRARKEIAAAYQETDGNLTKAAEKLGIPHRTLCRLMDRLDLWTALDQWCELQGIERNVAARRADRG